MTADWKKIVFPAKPQPDIIVAIFLLRAFGTKTYPGVEGATMSAVSVLAENPESLEGQGVLLLDIGGGKFDHHEKGKTVSQLVAEDLGIEKDPALERMLQYAERDDKHGLGTISSDPIDRAFGLSGLISSLTRSRPENPQFVIETVLPLLEAHYTEQRKWFGELPREFKEKLAEGKARVDEARHKGKKIRLVTIEADGQSMASYLRSRGGEKADVVMQKLGSGHVNIVTLQQKKIDLRMATGLVRHEEMRLRGKETNLSPDDLMKPGRVVQAPDWYYDTATNSLLNGGLHPEGTSPSIIPLERLRAILLEGLTYTPKQ